jgi:DnaJ-class molecular chaperone
MTPVPDGAGAHGGLYRRLEVGPAASHDEIVRAYRRLALGVHPDAHPEDPEATTRFREITEAYDVLADPERRQAYDRAVLGGRDRLHGGGSTTEVTVVTGTTQGQAAVSFLGAPGVERMGQVPLRVGPVRVSPPIASRGRNYGLAGLLFDILDSWRRG